MYWNCGFGMIKSCCHGTMFGTLYLMTTLIQDLPVPKPLQSALFDVNGATAVGQLIQACIPSIRSEWLLRSKRFVLEKETPRIMPDVSV